MRSREIHFGKHHHDNRMSAQIVRHGYTCIILFSTQFHPTINWALANISVPELKLIHISKKDMWKLP